MTTLLAYAPGMVLKPKNKTQIERWFHATTFEDVDTMRAMLEEGFDPNAKDDEGQTAIQHCARWNLGKVADFLLDEAKVNPNRAGSLTERPLWLAVRAHYPNMAMRLMQAGAEVEGTNQVGQNLALFLITVETSARMAPLFHELIVRGVDPAQEDKTNISAKERIERRMGFTVRNAQIWEAAMQEAIAQRTGQPVQRRRDQPEAAKPAAQPEPAYSPFADSEFRWQQD